MLKIDYQASQWVDVPDILEFFRDHGNIKEINRVKQLNDNLKFIFPGTTTTLQIVQGEGVYKFIVSRKKVVYGWVVFIPGDKRFDIYEAENPMIPMIQVKQKKIYHRTYSNLLAAANLERLFEKLFNLLT